MRLTEKEQERQRKADIKKGQRTQKMMTFRADLDVVGLLASVQNKGRLLNDLVREWAKGKNVARVDYPPEENTIPMEDE